MNSGKPIFLARKKLENIDAIFLPANYNFYKKISDQVMHNLRDYADHFEQVGIDEAYLDVTHKVDASFEKAKTLPQQIIDETKKQQKITSSIGVGPNKLVAKIAADNQKPEGLTVVKSEEVVSFLFPLPIRRLIGVGRKIEKKMKNWGIKTIGYLARYAV